MFSEVTEVLKHLPEAVQLQVTGFVNCPAYFSLSIQFLICADYLCFSLLLSSVSLPFILLCHWNKQNESVPLRD